MKTQTDSRTRWRFLRLSVIDQPSGGRGGWRPFLGGAWERSSLRLRWPLWATSAAFAAHATQGVDIKVTNDNGNVDGGTPNPSFDAMNKPAAHCYRRDQYPRPQHSGGGGGPITGWRCSTSSGSGCACRRTTAATWFEPRWCRAFRSDTSPCGRGLAASSAWSAGEPDGALRRAGQSLHHGSSMERTVPAGPTGARCGSVRGKVRLHPWHPGRRPARRTVRETRPTTPTRGRRSWHDRHRGSGRPLTPATPPCIRVRTRRFDWLR